MTIRHPGVSPIGERLDAIIEHFEINKNTFAKMIGLSDNSLISRIINEPKRGVSLDMLQKIGKAFPDINMRWLVLNEGEMLLKPAFPDPKLHYIEYYKGCEEEPVDLLRLYGYDDCTYACDVFGDIMAPKYRPGDIVLCKKINTDDPIRFGDAYLLIFNKVPNIRYIKSEVDGTFKLGAESPRYEDITVAKSDVERLCLIKGVIRREVF